MGGRDILRFFKSLILIFVVAPLLGAVMLPSMARAADLPLAAGSPLAGFAFDDRPLLLPVQRNFQMAMLTASSELGRSCGRMEAYGWRMNQAEQQRVNQIFNNTVDRLRGLGYSIEAEAPSSISHDITMFTADRPDKHFLFMWSAGEIGLVMTLCESTAPVSSRGLAVTTPSVRTFPDDVVASNLEVPVRPLGRKGSASKFTPIGSWIGNYTCAQGYTGGTLRITQLKGEDFQGTFHFYPTARNASVPEGRYAVSGQYDPDSHRILINPGKWLERPKNYYDTVMVGSFDPVSRTFSAYFQGITGCTSFEAKYAVDDYEDVITGRHVTKAKKKKSAKKKTAKNAASIPVTTAAPRAAGAPPAIAPVEPSSGINLGTPVAPAANVPSAQVPVATPSPSVAPAVPAPPLAAPASLPPASPPSQVPAVAAAPASNVTPSAALPAINPPAVATPSTATPSTAPPSTDNIPAAHVPSPLLGPTPMPVPSSTSTPLKPSGSIEPILPAPFKVASGEWFTPQAPQAPQATVIHPVAPQAQAPSYAPQATPTNPLPPQMPGPSEVPELTANNPIPPQAPMDDRALQPTINNPEPSQVPSSIGMDPRAPTAPPATWVDVPPGPQVPPPTAVH